MPGVKKRRTLLLKVVVSRGGNYARQWCASTTTLAWLLLAPLFVLLAHQLKFKFLVIFFHFLAGLNESKGAWNGQKRSVLVDTFLTSKQPEFDREKQQNVSALVGKTAFLTCSVHNLKPTQKVRFLHLVILNVFCMLFYCMRIHEHACMSSHTYSREKRLSYFQGTFYITITVIFM